MTDVTEIQPVRRREPLRAQREAPDAPEELPAAPVVCPNCSEPTQLVAVHKVAEEFCLACDHPLFWIPAFARHLPAGGDDDAGDAALRRRPGTAGRRRLAGRPCPECAEPNDVKAVYCLRCGSPMDPPPPPVVAVEPTVPTPTFVAEPSRPAIPYPLIAALAILALVLLIALVAVAVR